MAKPRVQFKELLWPFLNLPDDYVVLDLETTGLFDDEGAPSIVAIGLVVVSERKVVRGIEYSVRPSRIISNEALSVHGISQEDANEFPEIDECWNELSDLLQAEVIVIHNAAFDWVILNETASKRGLHVPNVEGVFCSQKLAYPWALALGLKVSTRGPSLDVLSEEIRLPNIRDSIGGLHGALIDAKQTFNLVEALRGVAES